MKIHEVLTIPNVISGELFFHPVGLNGYLHRVEMDTVYAVISTNFRLNAGCILPIASVLAGEWQTITKDNAYEILNKENK